MIVAQSIIAAGDTFSTAAHEVRLSALREWRNLRLECSGRVDSGQRRGVAIHVAIGLAHFVARLTNSGCAEPLLSRRNIGTFIEHQAIRIVKLALVGNTNLN